MMASKKGFSVKRVNLDGVLGQFTLDVKIQLSGIYGFRMKMLQMKMAMIIFKFLSPIEVVYEELPESGDRAKREGGTIKWNRQLKKGASPEKVTSARSTPIN